MIRDIRYVLRTWARDPGFVAIAVLVLALGIGATTALFTVVNGVLLTPLGYPEDHKLVQIARELPGGRISHATTHSQFLFWKESLDSFESMATYDGLGSGMNLATDTEPLRVNSFRVSTGFFQTLRTPPQLGRDFLKEDGQEGADRVAIISDGLWRRSFGEDPGVVGRDIRLNTLAHKVIGVMQPGFDFINHADVWTPLVLDPDGNSAVYYVVARLTPSADLDSAKTEVLVSAETYRATFPDRLGEGTGFLARPYREQLVGNVRDALMLLLGAVFLVLLIACSNVANLLLTRGLSRKREIAVRQALGASRFRLIRQSLTESLLLAFAGGLAGIVLAQIGVEGLLALRPVNLPLLDGISIDERVLAFSLAGVLTSTLFFGVLPALQSLRQLPQEALRSETGRESSGLTGRRARSCLVVSEVALALVLLVGAALLLTSLSKLYALEPGFDHNHVLTMKMSLGTPEAITTGSFVESTRLLAEQIEELPGVETAATISTLPLEHGLMTSFDVEGQTPPNPKERAGSAQSRLISPGYFDAMGIPLLKGRQLTLHDKEGAPPVAIINKAFADQYFKDEDPVGKGLLTGRPGAGVPPTLIVGVVGNISELALDQPPTPTLFSPAAQASDGLTGFLARMIPTCWVLRTKGDPMAQAETIRKAILKVDPDQPVSDVRAMDELLGASAAQHEFSAALLAVFAAIALVLALVGVYGVISFSVAQRRREIGIRMSLGAVRRDTLFLVLKHGLGLTAIGIGIGLVAAFGMGRFLEGFLFGVEPGDPWTLGLMTMALFLIGGLACLIPASRAMAVDPVTALRAE